MKNVTDEDRPLWLELMDAQGNREYRTSWRFPSGGFGEVSIQFSADRRQKISLSWYAPPADPRDLDVLYDVVLPEALARANETRNRSTPPDTIVLARTPAVVLG